MYNAKSGSSPNNNKEKQPQTTWPKWAKTFWKVYFILFGVVCLMFLFISLGWMGYMPSFAELENPDSNLATEVISSDGVLLGTYYRENRSNCKYADLSNELKDALIATEDSRFYKHSGVDVKALFRVAVGVITRHHKGGGSTRLKPGVDAEEALTYNIARFHVRAQNYFLIIYFYKEENT